jgi:hypothetical protein
VKKQAAGAAASSILFRLQFCGGAAKHAMCHEALQRRLAGKSIGLGLFLRATTYGQSGRAAYNQHSQLSSPGGCLKPVRCMHSPLWQPSAMDMWDHALAWQVQR